MPKTMKNKKIHNKKKQSKLARLVEKVEANRIKRGYPLRSSIKRKPLSNKDNLDILRYYNISANKKKVLQEKQQKRFWQINCVSVSKNSPLETME